MLSLAPRDVIIEVEPECEEGKKTPYYTHKLLDHEDEGLVQNVDSCFEPNPKNRGAPHNGPDNITTLPEMNEGNCQNDSQKNEENHEIEENHQMNMRKRMIPYSQRKFHAVNHNNKACNRKWNNYTNNGNYKANRSYDRNKNSNTHKNKNCNLNEKNENSDRPQYVSDIAENSDRDSKFHSDNVHNSDRNSKHVHNPDNSDTNGTSSVHYTNDDKNVEVATDIININDKSVEILTDNVDTDDKNVELATDSVDIDRSLNCKSAENSDINEMCSDNTTPKMNKQDIPNNCRGNKNKTLNMNEGKGNNGNCNYNKNNNNNNTGNNNNNNNNCSNKNNNSNNNNNNNNNNCSNKNNNNNNNKDSMYDLLSKLNSVKGILQLQIQLFRRRCHHLLDSWVLFLHYRLAFLFFFFGGCIVVYDWYTDNEIVCVGGFSVDEKPKNYILNICLSYSRYEMVHKSERFILFYRWIHYVFLAVAGVMYLPRVMLKRLCHKRAQRLYADLADGGGRSGFARDSAIDYFKKNLGGHQYTYLVFLANHLVAACLSALSFYFLDFVLQGTFTSLVVTSFPFRRDAEGFLDPLSVAFPPFVTCKIDEGTRMQSSRKETFYCHLTLMELYEKWFVASWFLLAALVCIAAGSVVCIVLLATIPCCRKYLILRTSTTTSFTPSTIKEHPSSSIEETRNLLLWHLNVDDTFLLWAVKDHLSDADFCRVLSAVGEIIRQRRTERKLEKFEFFPKFLV